MQNKVESHHRTLEKLRGVWEHTINIINNKEEEEIRINLLASYFGGHAHMFIFKKTPGGFITEMGGEGGKGRQ